MRREQGRLADAAVLFERAVAALEAQRGRVSGPYEARSLFASRFFGIYHDQAELLARLGRPAEAFHVLEQSRARLLLALTAERELVLDDEIPTELERERRRTDAAYERVRDALHRLDPAADAAEVERLALQASELRDQQSAIADRIRRLSPRLAQVRYPEPLQAASLRRLLDPGSVFLSYSVGKQKTLLFAVVPPRAGAGPAADVTVVTIDAGEDALRERVARLRDLVERAAPPPRFFSEAAALYDLLLRPVERFLRRAGRLIVSPDGPLHDLPFAALRRRGRYLAESKRCEIVPSGTALAQWIRAGPPAPRALDVEGFGDPSYGEGPLQALPASRRELAAIVRLFPRAAVHLGQDAAEERAKALSRGVRYVHFACHGLIDDRSPLDSALALSPPAAGAAAERDNGLLYAWEVFERVRLDADLVTLSACRSEAGAVRAGEGLIGLTRAFQYAGARAVLASLWSVGDRSTVPFMTRLYRHLRSGLAADEALRRAQTAAIRSGQHPLCWAAFQLYGYAPAVRAERRLALRAPRGPQPPRGARRPRSGRGRGSTLSRRGSMR